MSAYDSVRTRLRETLDEIEAAGLTKRERQLTTPQSSHIGVAGSRLGSTTEATEALNFCANNYLGLADDPRVLAAATEALASIRKNGRPFLLEAQTYRLRGHFEPDDQGYVDQQELASWRLRDPLPKMQARLLDQGIIDQAGLDALSVEIAQCIDAAAVFAIASPYPAVAELHTDIFA